MCLNKKRMGKSKSTPLPWGKLLIVSFVFFINQFGVHLLFPFLPYMIHDFFPELDRTQIGQKAGYLGSAYFGGNFLGSLFWGWMSDMVGRRPVLLWGMCGILFSEVLFAFSQNFGWAVAARFLWGALNGNLGITKTYVSEGSTFGGFLAQPASKYPALQLPVFCQYPYSLPVLMAAGLAAFTLTIVWLFIDETLQKEKSKSSGLSQEDSGIELSSTDSALESDTEMTDMLRGSESEGAISEQPLRVAESEVDTDDCDIERVSSDTELLVRKRQSQTKWPCLPSCNPLFICIKFKERVTDCVKSPIVICRYARSFKHRGSCSLSKAFSREMVTRNARQVWEGIKKRVLLMADRRVFFSVLMYGLFAFVAIIILELIPLIFVTKHEDGGYSLDDNELSVIFIATVAVELPFHSLVFPRITKLIGFRNTFRLGVFLFGVATFVYPFSNQITGPIPHSNMYLLDNGTAGSGMSPDDEESSGYCNYTLYVNSSFQSSVNVNSVARVPIYVWFVVIFIESVMVIGRVMAFTATFLLISNSSLPATKGMVNGIGQTLAAFGRLVGPAIGAPAFAWTESTGLGWPLNFHLIFDLVVISSVGIILLSLFIPKSIELKREALPSNTVSVVKTSIQTVTTSTVEVDGLTDEHSNDDTEIGKILNPLLLTNSEGSSSP